MKIKGHAFFWILWASVAFYCGPANANLAQRIQQETSSPDKRSWETLGATLSRYHVVFVGIRDGLFRPLDGFKDNVQALREDLGFKNISVINTGFFESYESNADLLSEGFRQLFRDGGNRPLIVIGNPQSGPDGLLAILRHPDLLDAGMIEKIILLQPAFGSPLADAGSAIPMAAEIAKQFFGEDIGKFSTHRTRELFMQSIERLREDQRSNLDSRLYYVRSSADPRRVAETLLVPPYLLLRPFGETDAISFTSAQRLDGIGNDLGIINASHWDLFASFPASNAPANFRRSFTRALLEEVIR